MYYAEQLGITLPDYPLTAADRDGTAAALRDAIAAGEWLPVDTPIDGDMVTMAHQRDPCHIGMFARSEEHTSELQSLMRISYAVFCLKTKTNTTPNVFLH